MGAIRTARPRRPRLDGFRPRPRVAWIASFQPRRELEGLAAAALLRNGRLAAPCAADARSGASRSAAGAVSAKAQAAPMGLATAPKPKRLFSLRKALKLALAAIAIAHAFYIGCTTVLVACYAFITPPVTTLSLARKYLDAMPPERPRPVRLKDVTRTARRMVVAVEDYRFWEHGGFDLEAISRAIRTNLRSGKIRVGASTLTMQTARTLFLVPNRTYLRKYLESIVTVELELILSKERILELYLSWAEWGKGVYGIDAASRKYYGKAASKLGVEEAARLVALLSSPIKYTPKTLHKSRALSQRYEFLLSRFGS